MYWCFTCMHMHHAWCLRRLEETVWAPETGVRAHWEPNLGTLQQLLSTAKLPLQLPCLFVFFFFNKGSGDWTLHVWAVSILQTKLSLQAQTKGSRKNRAVTKWISRATVWKRNEVRALWISVWEPGVSGSKTLLTASCVWRKDKEQKRSNKRYQKAWENLWGGVGSISQG